ncbi:MAG: metallophosphoesterase [Bacteroidales bacterium]|nr:metallophosphoesterase [Bacteroidales bacterium]
MAMKRRDFFRAAASATAAAPVLGICYGFAESIDYHVVRRSVVLPRLAPAFDGTTVAFLTDIHLGPYLAPDTLAAIVRTTRILNPDLILLGGDYTLRDGSYAGPCFDVLSQLQAPLGVFGVLGNHDYIHGLDAIRAGMRYARIAELHNSGVWISRRGERFRVCGVDDLWRGHPDVAAAIGETRPDDACLLVSHNPDVAETLTDPRVGLVLSGHTHGGQVVIPGYGPPMIPSRYGAKYAYGFVDAPITQVLVSSGIGMSGIPIRMNCRPEIVLLTLHADRSPHPHEMPAGDYGFRTTKVRPYRPLLT